MRSGRILRKLFQEQELAYWLILGFKNSEPEERSVYSRNDETLDYWSRRIFLISPLDDGQISSKPLFLFVCDNV